MSPCSARTLWPRAERSSARRWQPILVRAKTIAQRGCLGCEHAARAPSSFPRGSTSITRCSIALDGDVLGRDADRLGRVQLLAGQLADLAAASWPRTARSGGPTACARRIARTSSMKPIESISSASSSTTMRASAQHQLAALQQVEHAAGRADDDLRAARESVDLLADRRAAVDRHDVDAVEVTRRSSRAASATCSASSRVGHSTSAWTTSRVRGRCARGSGA